MTSRDHARQVRFAVDSDMGCLLRNDSGLDESMLRFKTSARRVIVAEEHGRLVVGFRDCGALFFPTQAAAELFLIKEITA